MLSCFGFISFELFVSLFCVRISYSKSVMEADGTAAQPKLFWTVAKPSVCVNTIHTNTVFVFFFLRWRTERNGNIECQTYNIRALHFTTTLIRHTHSYTDCVMRNEHRTIPIYALKINTLTYLWHLSITVRKHMVCLHFLFLPFALYE